MAYNIPWSIPPPPHPHHTCTHFPLHNLQVRKHGGPWGAAHVPGGVGGGADHK